MKFPGSSILRTMAAIALAGLALAIFRTFALADKDHSDRVGIGELAPLSLIGLSGSIIALLTSGRLRRFASVLAITGVVVGFTFLLAPLPFRNAVLNRVIIPIDARIGPRTEGPPETDLIWSIYWVFDIRQGLHATRSPFHSRETQTALGLLELTVAAFVGLISVIPGPRRSLPSSQPISDL